MTAAKIHNLTLPTVRLHGNEEVVYGDAGYQAIAKRPEMGQDNGIPYRVLLGKRCALSDTLKGRPEYLIETAKAHIRSKVEPHSG